jgi:hypothetical protein
MYIFISFSQSTGECVAKLGKEVTWMILYIFISFSQSTGECVAKLGREVTWMILLDCEKEIKMYRIIQVISLPSLATHSPVDCEKEIKMYRIIQVTSLPSLATHSPVLG